MDQLPHVNFDVGTSGLIIEEETSPNVLVARGRGQAWTVKILPDKSGYRPLSYACWFASLPP